MTKSSEDTTWKKADNPRHGRLFVVVQGLVMGGLLPKYQQDDRALVLGGIQATAWQSNVIDDPRRIEIIPLFCDRQLLV
jgi:hypothetical protein